MAISRQKSVFAVVLTLLFGAGALMYTYRDPLGLAEPPTAEQVKNVRAFAKLYGYVRYFHPSDAAAETDWEKFAIHGVRQARDATDRARPLGPSSTHALR